MIEIPENVTEFKASDFEEMTEKAAGIICGQIEKDKENGNCTNLFASVNTVFADNGGFPMEVVRDVAEKFREKKWKVHAQARPVVRKGDARIFVRLWVSNIDPRDYFSMLGIIGNCVDVFTDVTDAKAGPDVAKAVNEFWGRNG